MDLIDSQLITTALGALALLIGSVLLIMVLIKSFKEGGLLHGLLGLLTGGVYTFVWGWLKARRLHLTTAMVLWTACIMAGGALVYVTGPVQLLQSLPWAAELGLVASGPAKQPAAVKIRKRVAQKPRVAPAGREQTAGGPLHDADWNTRALALWKDAGYVDVEKAVALLENAVKEDPNFAEAYNNRGNAYRDMKQYALAMQDYNRAVSLNPNLAKTYNNRGNIYFDQGNFQMAVADYDKALALDATYNLAFLNRGLAYHGLNRDELACPDFYKACELGDCDGIDWARKSGTCP